MVPIPNPKRALYSGVPFTRIRYRYGSVVITAPPDTSSTAPDTHAAASDAK